VWWIKYHSSDCFCPVQLPFCPFVLLGTSSNYALKGCLPVACALPIKGGLRRVLLAALNSKVLYHRPRELSTRDAALGFASKKSPATCAELFWVSLYWTTRTQTRESSDKPMLNAFCRVAPTVRFSVLAICAACVFFRARAFNVRTCSGVHSRRFVALLAIQILPILRKATL
jgi:hypothetical protein